MDKINTREDLEEYFRKVGCLGRYNYCFVCSVPTNNMFGAVGVLISVKKNKNVMGYLLNKIPRGICLIPIMAKSLVKNEIDREKFVFISEENIRKVTVKNDGIGVKRITILTTDGEKYVMNASKTVAKQPYHKENLDKFTEIYQ